MPTEIESLSISIEAKATKANDAIDRLVGKLDRLSTSLGGLKTGNLNGPANGVDALVKSMQTMNNIKTSGFARLSGNLSKLSTINVSSLYSTANSLSHLLKAFNALGPVSANAQQVGVLAANLSKLGGANIQRAIVNIPLLASSLSSLMTTLSRSPVVSQNVIQMTNALANLSAQGARVGSASRSIERGLNRASTSAERARKSYGGLASAIGKFYATYFLVIRAIKGLGKSIISTADYIEAFNYFNVALGKIGSDWSHQFEQYGYENAEAYANSFSERLTQSLSGLSGVKIEMSADGSGLLTESGMKNLGLNIREITKYASQLASVTNSVGQTGEVSLATASAFTKLGADLSSLFNLDYADAMRNLQSGLIGQSRALYKYGIDITNATLQTYAYELGLEKAVSEMTQAEKMQLRMIAILEQSKVSWGDLANTINSPSNMLRQFKNNLKEVGMILGQLFIPLMQRVMPVVNGVTIAIKRLLTNIAGFMGVKLDLSSFGQGYTQIEDEFGNIEDSVDGATEAIDKFKSHTLGIDELNIASPDTSGADTSGLDNTIDLTKEIIAATEDYEKVWASAFEQMENKAEAIADVISKYFQPIEDTIKRLAEPTENFVKAIGNLYTELAPFASGFGKGFIDFIGAFAEVNLEIITGLLEGLAKAVGLVPEDVLEAVGYGLGVLGASLITISTISKLSALFGALSGGLAGLGATLAAHPILTTFTISAGLIALFDLLKTDYNTKVIEQLGTDWIGNLDGLQKSAEEASKQVDILKGKLSDVISGDADSELEYYYEKWKGLHDNLENLTKEEEGLLVLYAKRIEDEFPGAAQYIDQNGKAYEGMVDNLDDAIQKALVLAKIQSAESIIGDLTYQQYLSEKDIESLQKELDNILLKASAEIDFLNGKTLEELKEFFELYSKIEVPGTKEVLEDTAYFNKKAKEDLALLKLIEEYKQSNEALNIQEGNLLEIEKSLENATGYIEKVKEEYENLNKNTKDGIDNILLYNSTATETIEKDFILTAKEIEKLKFKIKSFNDLKVEIPVNFKIEDSPIRGLFTGANIVLNAPKYEVGGFPEDGLFFANHNELVGQFSNGKTAVANNVQIVDGIKEGVKEAVAEILAPYLADIAQSNREVANKDLSVNIGDREIARANARGQRSLGYQLIT